MRASMPTRNSLQAAYLLSFHLLALSSAHAQTGIEDIPELSVIGNVTARQEACLTLPQPAPAYLDSSFLGELLSVQAGPVNFSYHQFGPLNGAAVSSGLETSPLLLIAGQGATWPVWTPGLLRGLAQDRSVTIFDHQGLGRSIDSRGDLNYTLAQLAEGIQDLVTALDLGQPDVLGWSMGGAVTLTTTVTFPDTFRKVVLVDTGAGGDGERLSGDAAEVRPILQSVYNTGQSIASPIVFPDTPSGNAAMCRATAWSQLHTDDAASTAGRQKHAGLIDSYFGYPSTGDNYVFDRLGNITQPTLIIVGTLDIVLDPEDSQVLVDTIPGASLHRFIGSGHAPVTQEETAMARLVADFLDFD